MQELAESQAIDLSGSERGTRTPDQRIMIREKRENEHNTQQARAIESTVCLFLPFLVCCRFLPVSVPPVSHASRPRHAQPLINTSERATTGCTQPRLSARSLNACGLIPTMCTSSLTTPSECRSQLSWQALRGTGVELSNVSDSAANGTSSPRAAKLHQSCCGAGRLQPGHSLGIGGGRLDLFQNLRLGPLPAEAGTST